MRWEKVSLESISTRIGDGLHGTPKYDESGEFYFINGNNLADGKILIKEDTKRISSIEYDKIKKELNDKTVFVAINGTLGNIGLYRGEPVALGKSACYINVNEKSERLFVRYVLENQDFQTYALDFATGATIKNLGLKAVRDYSFNLPPLPTQRKIASILSAYDDLIENNLKRIKLLEEAAEIVYKGEFDFFKPSNEINKIPEGWKVKRADEIFRINIGKTPPREQDEWFNDIDSGIKWVSIKDINNSTVYMLNTSETVTENAVNKFNMNVAMTDTVLLSFKLTVGKVAITTEEMVTNEAIAHFNSDDESRMNSEFIYFYLKNFPYDSLGSTSSIGTAINSKIVKAMPVLLPSKSIIQEFGRKVKPSFQMIKALLKQNAKLREARDILLPKLMNGQIEV
jgi:type I restriction enzyme S subunit